ncbi:DUF1638 domain-containing protein [Acetobacterium woodii]|uniref:DUF1638 domain-containing protein n=1 Tax=Acetobacterium woodii (strain ATCC 29683 / DSM 1030 / JCM 2381 / KCTC 1655 / WB1) TaxID=931626 RepID=H6LHK0_ACEWD|nr:DUF1638 domain-containing protein [Acetobacterium woodii]AFA49710.1 hypothetical protein Awo_c29760 [Acetobacterium woodii DSM 1030]
MKRLLIACETIKDEVEMAIKKTGIEMETIWMSNLLHDSPERLKNALQAEIDKAEAFYDQLLFAYGNCGNGLLGLKSEKAVLVIPRFGDCIDILLSEKENIERLRTSTYFLTQGWLKGEKSLDREYQHNLAKYGEKRARRVMDIMFKNYKNLMLIDTGAYQVADLMPRVNGIGELIGLKVVVEPGTISPLTKLITGQWSDEFCIIPPGRTTNHQDFEGVAVRNV